MSKDYIGPFGPESIEAAKRAVREAFPEQTARYERCEPVEDQWIIPLTLSAAVGALDLEALVERYEAILREHDVKVSARTVVYGDAHHRFRTNIASALVEALFPTEPEAQDGG